MLIQCHKEMSGRKATGVDEVTKAEYDQNLDGNLDNLIARMKRQAYKPQPARRVNIPKPGSEKKRQLGIPAYEDKLVQSALRKILNAIYEQDFLECSFGFRPGRGCHDALKLLNKIAIQEFKRILMEQDESKFLDVEEGDIWTSEEARSYLEAYLMERWSGKSLEDLINDKNIRTEIIAYLKINTRLSVRKIADLLGINR